MVSRGKCLRLGGFKLISRLEELRTLHSLRTLDVSSNKIKKLKELEHVQDLPYLSNLDLCFNQCQKFKFFRIQVIYKIPQLRVLDGVEITAKDLVKSEIFFGHDLQDKKEIYSRVLPDEEFVDRRLISSHMLDPESDSEVGDYDFFDK